MIFFTFNLINKYHSKIKIHPKLVQNFYGTYKIIRCTVKVACDLDLKRNSKIHLMFHVSCLKKVWDQYQSVNQFNKTWWRGIESYRWRSNARYQSPSIMQENDWWSLDPMENMHPNDGTCVPVGILHKFSHLHILGQCYSWRGLPF